MMLSSAPIAAQPDEPVVSITVTPANGSAKTLSAADSHVATLTVGGVEYGFEPTIQDSSPWNRVTITVLKMPTSAEATVILGEADLKAGGPAVTTRTTPSFKIDVTHVAPPANESVRGTT
jgi:hypothetical protein